MESYYVALNDKQQGPYGLAQLEVMMNTGRLTASDLCWREGMEHWQPIRDTIPSLAGHVVPAEDFNPYAPPQSDISAPPPALREYGGIRRLPYFGLNLLLAVVYLASAGAAGEDQTVEGALLAGNTIGSLIIVYQRLKNIGMNPWWCLLALVPVANIVIGFRCIACQEGYVETRTLDPAGRIVAWIFGILLAIIFLAAVTAVVSG